MEKVRFACPRCQTIMQTGAEKVGYDVACPHCGHRFRLVESGESGSIDRHDASLSSDAATLPPSSFPQSSQPVSPEKSAGFRPASSASLGNANPQKPAIGSMDESRFSSVASPYAAPARQTGFCCPYCQTTRPPIWKSEVSQIGWIVFAILLMTTCVFCFVGLFIRDRYRICSQCRIRLS